MPSKVTLFLSALVMSLALASCGGGDDSDSGRISKVEQAFLEGMIPHHESAVDMAEQALDDAEHEQVKELAAAIVDAQTAEIAQMEDIHERLADEEIMPDPAAHGALGLSQDEAGMHGGGALMLERGRGFDKRFIDAMIPHHQGAIRMAHVMLADTDDAELEKLGKAIIDAQSEEIKEMNTWRRRWYGVKSPAGGVPGLDELPPTENPEEHPSH